MKFRSKVLRAAAVAALAALLASCGGESLVAFVPARLLVFGDQSSVITLEPVPTQGKKYNINAVNADGTFNCAGNPLWVQILATSYGLGFAECPGPSANTSGRILAKAGATAGGTREIDLAEQITQQLNKPVADGGGITSTDMVTLLVGVNDVVAAFERYEAGASLDEVRAQTEAAGVAIAAQVARIAAAGGKVIVSTVPDVGVTPYGLSKVLTGGNAILTFLTLRVNNQFLLELQNSGNNNGRKIGLIELNPYLISVVANPAAYLYANVVNSSCAPQDPPNPLNCTASTVNTDLQGNPACFLNAGTMICNWLWASELQLSPKGHGQLGNLATSRAHNQPF